MEGLVEGVDQQAGGTAFFQEDGGAGGEGLVAQAAACADGDDRACLLMGQVPEHGQSVDDILLSSGGV